MKEERWKGEEASGIRRPIAHVWSIQKRAAERRMTENYKKESDKRKEAKEN